MIETLRALLTDEHGMEDWTLDGWTEEDINALQAIISTVVMCALDFENKVPFSTDEIRSIIDATREEGNQAGIDKFMELYGVSGLSNMSAQFAEGVKVSIK